MANTLRTALQAPATSSARRIGALKAFFLAKDIESIQQIDFSLDLLKTATVLELQTALAEAAEVRKTRMEDRIRKWMGDSDYMTVGVCTTDEWLSVERARVANLKKRSISSFCMLVYNQLEVYQVCHNHQVVSNSRTQYHFIYHIQPLSCPSESGYYRKQAEIRNGRWCNFTEPTRITTLPADATSTRYFRGTMSNALMRQLAAAPGEPVIDPLAAPLHQLIVP